MESLTSRAAHTVSRSWSIAAAGNWRNLGGCLSSSVLQSRSYAHEGLDGRLPAGPEASSATYPVVDTPLLREFPPAFSKTRTTGAGRTFSSRNRYPPRKWEAFTAYSTLAMLRPKLTRIALDKEESPVGNCPRASNNVAQESYQDSPREGFVSGKELSMGSACGGHNIHIREAVSFLKNRLQQGIIIDSYTFVEVLKRCSNEKDLMAVRQVHDCIIQSGMDKNPYVVNSLLNIYVKCGRLKDARRVFDELEEKTAVTWRTMIAGYAKNGHAEDALEVFNRMRQGGSQPDELLCLSILKACARRLALQSGKEIHAYIRHAGHESDVRVGTALIQMYAKCGCITEAKQVFEKLTNRNVITLSVMIDAYAESGSIDDARRLFDKIENRDIITWNIIIGAYAKNGRGVEAYECFLQMKRDGFVPDALTCVSILNVSASAGALEWVKEVHSHAVEAGLESDLRLGNALIHMYARSGSIEDARLLFDRMVERNVIIWTTMIGAYARSGCGLEAYELFLQMQREGIKPNAITYVSILNASASEGALEWVKGVHSHAHEAGLESDSRVGNALIHMYAKSRSIGNARMVFDRLRARDVITWTTMIGAYAENGCGLEAYRLFLQMQREGIKPNSFTYASILNASASAGALDWVNKIHRHALEAGLESDLHVGSALVHMYAKSGSIDGARQIFDRMEKRNVITWTVMIGGLTQHGCDHEALELFREMEADGVKPIGTAFLAVLSACSHAGLVDDGRRLFVSMKQDYGIEPTVEHYTCMVDLLGRSGHLEEAKLFIDDMPSGPHGGTWRTLLSACRRYGNVELGALAANEVFKLEPKNSAAYALLSNTYASAGK